MGLNDLPALDLIRSRMAWLSSHHAVIADNIAQSARPGFVPRDLTPFATPGTLRLARSQGNPCPRPTSRRLWHTIADRAGLDRE